MIITGTAQHEAWQQRVLPPIEQVRPDVWSIPVPIPNSPLRYTLSYCFLDETGVLLVDPGWDSGAGRAALEHGLAAAGAGLDDLAGVVVTHVHPDHHGMSGWLRERTGAWIGMHPAEAATLPVRAWRHGAPVTDRAWLLRNGAPEAEIDGLLMPPDRVEELMGMVEPDRPIEDGDLLPLSRHELRAVWTPGHTPGHLCLHEPAAGVLLTGDHLLPRISPNIGVHAITDGNPLGAYLASLEQVAKYGADEALPAHEYRFRDLDSRAADLIRHHDDRGAEILRAIASLDTPTGWAIAARITWSRGWDALQGILRRLALAETIAHLEHLSALGTVQRSPDEPVRWRATA